MFVYETQGEAGGGLGGTGGIDGLGGGNGGGDGLGGGENVLGRTLVVHTRRLQLGTAENW